MNKDFKIDYDSGICSINLTFQEVDLLKNIVEFRILNRTFEEVEEVRPLIYVQTLLEQVCSLIEEVSLKNEIDADYVVIPAEVLPPRKEVLGIESKSKKEKR
ncbi:MAG: hypothetical protein WC942_07495 [Clostridia bacterium]|jgi:hypothetical protein